MERKVGMSDEAAHGGLRRRLLPGLVSGLVASVAPGLPLSQRGLQLLQLTFAQSGKDMRGQSAGKFQAHARALPPSDLGAEWASIANGQLNIFPQTQPPRHVIHAASAKGDVLKFNLALNPARRPVGPDGFGGEAFGLAVFHGAIRNSRAPLAKRWREPCRRTLKGKYEGADSALGGDRMARFTAHGAQESG